MMNIVIERATAKDAAAMIEYLKQIGGDASLNRLVRRMRQNLPCQREKPKQYYQRKCKT